MGGAQTKEAVLYFTAVANDEAPPDEKEFVERLVLYKKNLCSGAEHFHASLPVLRELVPSCVKTGRVRWLLHFCMQRLEEASCNYSQGRNEAFLASLHIMGFVVRYALQVTRGKPEELLPIVLGEELDSEYDDISKSQWRSTEVSRFCNALMDYCVSVPLSSSTVEAHAEVVSLLLSMMSSALYHSTNFNERGMDVFTELIIMSETLSAFLAMLLRRVVDWGAGSLPSSPKLYRDGHQPSLRNLYNVFGGGSSSSGGKSENSISCGEHLGRHCAHLLALLVAFQKDKGRNPVLDYMTSIEDGVPVPFKLLSTTLVSRLQVCPALCIVIYTMVYDHPTFLHTMMTVSPANLLDLIQEVLHLGYKVTTCDVGGSAAASAGGSGGGGAQVLILEEEASPDALPRIMREMTFFSYPFISFMISTLVLIFSQDQVLNKYMSDTVLQPRFKVDRYLGKVPLSSLCIVVLTHGITKALNEKSEQLAAVFIPSLLNLAPFIHSIDHYTAQRLLRLLILTQRKLRRSLELSRMGASNRTDASGISNGDDGDENDGNKKSAACRMFLRQLSALSEAIEVMLQGNDRQNDALIYELLYNHRKLEDKLTPEGSNCPYTTAACNALRPLLSITKFYETEVASVTSAESTKDILSIIHRVTLEQKDSTGVLQNAGSNAGRLGGSAPWKTQEIHFVYEESPHSYDFFGPFVWATLLSDAAHPGGLLWVTNTAALGLFPQ